MKVNEIITEVVAPTPQEIAAIIRRDCGPFLAMIGNEPLKYRIFRGIMKKLPYFSKQKCPVNRKPRDTHPTVSKIVDKWFLDTMGVRFRSNATFGSGDLDLVEDQYGPAFTVLPIGEFDYCWSPRVSDMTYDLFDIQGVDWSDPQEITDRLEDAFYIVNENMPKAIDSGNEIMLHCVNGFYMLYHENHDDAPFFGKDDEVLRFVADASLSPISDEYEKKKKRTAIKAAATKLNKQNQYVDRLHQMISAYQHALTLPINQRQSSLVAAGEPVDGDKITDAGLNYLISYWSPEFENQKLVAQQMAEKLKAMSDWL